MLVTIIFNIDGASNYPAAISNGVWKTVFQPTRVRSPFSVKAYPNTILVNRPHSIGELGELPPLLVKAFHEY